jgi:hypothetical protein
MGCSRPPSTPPSSPTSTPPQPPPEPPGCADPARIRAGGPCNSSGNLACPSEIPEYGCDGQIVGHLSCYCSQYAWTCPEPELPACPEAGPPPVCPDPYSVGQGLACSDPGQVCAGNPSWCDGQLDYDAFECQGGVWTDIASTVCEGEGGIEDAGPVDAGFSDR